MSGRVSLGGTSTNPAAYGASTQYSGADSIPLPSGSISRPETLLKRGAVSQALLDVGALLFISFFIVSGALSFPLAIFLLLFARF